MVRLTGENGATAQTVLQSKKISFYLLPVRVCFKAAVDTDMLTAQIENVQAKINTARVQAGSQYAAIESAISLQLI